MVGKRPVIVTGGAGFIGGHLVELLLKHHFPVVVADIQKPGKTYFFLNKLDKKTEYHMVDITKRRAVESLFSLIHPQYVIHLAALPVVGEAYEYPRKAFETNIMGTVNILEACRKDRKIDGIIVASSDKAYGKTIKTYTEESPLKGDHPYDVSKSCEDLIAQTYHKTYGMPIIITRFGNVYGEGDLHFDRIVPGICKSVASGTPLEIRSDGTYVRDYLYVKDVAEGYVFLLKHIGKLKGEAFNFSSSDNYSVLDLVRQSQFILKKTIAFVIKNTARNEIPFQHLDDSKICKFGWKSMYTFRNTLPAIYSWYKKFLQYR